MTRKVEEKAASIETAASHLKDEFKIGDALLKSVNYMRKHMQDEAVEMRKKLIDVDSVVRSAEEYRHECKTTLGIVDGKELLVRSYSDCVQNSEAAVKQNYTRSLYAATITRQIAMMCLHTLGGTLRLLKTMHLYLRAILPVHFVARNTIPAPFPSRK